MKRILIVVVCIAFAFTFAVPVFAEVDPDAFWIAGENGPSGYDYDGYHYALAQDMVASSGVALNPDDYYTYDGVKYHFDWDGFQADYNALVPAEPTVEDTPSNIESVETTKNNEVTVDNGNAEIVETESSSPVLSDTLETSELANEPAAPENTTYSVTDLRASDSGVASQSTGIKALITSIFGEYTPVKSSAVVSETVNGEVNTTIIDIVAPGMAGVDFQWLAGVLLFAILLFCLMKLLGGVLS